MKKFFAAIFAYLARLLGRTSPWLALLFSPVAAVIGILTGLKNCFFVPRSTSEPQMVPTPPLSSSQVKRLDAASSKNRIDVTKAQAVHCAVAVRRLARSYCEGYALPKTHEAVNQEILVWLSKLSRSEAKVLARAGAKDVVAHLAGEANIAGVAKFFRAPSTQKVTSEQVAESVPEFSI